jgi:hypothetical protein
VTLEIARGATGEWVDHWKLRLRLKEKATFFQDERDGIRRIETELLVAMLLVLQRGEGREFLWPVTLLAELR